MVVHVCSLTTREAEAGRSIKFSTFRPAWATQWDPLSEKQKEKRKKC
jgi:hypothetical protein